MKYRPVIGLEIHVELKTKTKMFCNCLNDPGETRPNLNICPVCLGHPGTLPVINQEAVKKTIKTGLALNCKIPLFSKFDRKNYFYPDLPKGYQISQKYIPLCKKGFLKVNKRKIKIKEIHLEEDTGRLIHPEGEDYSLVDFNRAGVPLMELVTEPDLDSAKEARSFAEELRLILRYLEVSDADMEKGQMRVEVNISLSPLQRGEDSNRGLGTKVEIKNLNSFKAVEGAIDYEIKRQEKALRAGKKITQETRGWDNVKNRTISQREKEYAQDYRYFPEPDLPQIKWRTKEDIKEIKAELPELPRKKRERFKKEYKLSNKEIEVLVQNKELGEYFEKIISELPPKLPREKLLKLTRLTSNYLITDLQGLLKGKRVSDKDFLITPENFAEFVVLIHEGEISSKIAKTLLPEMLKTGTDPSHIIEEKGLVQISDEFVITDTASEVISENPKAVSDYKKGKKESLEFLIGQMMAKEKGRIDPKTARKEIKKRLKNHLNNHSITDSEE
jgi:aspartyl-tRNA(Asn)/glutamyl-tRNA(Gln) amidotransferase subunit B